MGNDLSIEQINQGVEQKLFDQTDLAEFHGKGFTPAAVAIFRKVFDVSSKKDEYYGPDGSYECFVGKDATRALGMNLKNQSDTMSLDDCTEEQLEVAWEWQDYYTKRYPCIGWLQIEGEDVDEWRAKGEERLQVLLAKEKEENAADEEDKEPAQLEDGPGLGQPKQPKPFARPKPAAGFVGENGEDGEDGGADGTTNLGGLGGEGSEEDPACTIS